MNKVKGKIQKTMDQIERELGGDSAVVVSGGPPIPLDLNNPTTFFRYRKQRGVNLGTSFRFLCTQLDAHVRAQVHGSFSKDGFLRRHSAKPRRPARVTWT